MVHVSHNLNDDELVILKALVEGQGMVVLKKLIQQQITNLQNQLSSENSDKEIYRLQGRIAEARSLVLVPQAIVAMENQKFKKNLTKPKK